MPEQVSTEQAPDIAAVQSGATLTLGTSTPIAVANASRERLVVSVNAFDVWLGYGEAAVVGKGHCVRAAGSPFEERAWKGAVNAISAGAAVVGVTETSYAVGDDQGEEPVGGLEFVPHGPSDTPIAAPTSFVFGQ